MRLSIIVGACMFIAWDVNAQNDIDFEKVRAIQSEIDLGCHPDHQWESCRATIDDLLGRVKDERPEIQLTVFQVLLSKSGFYSEAIDYAYNKLTLLSELHPENKEYLTQRAFVRFHMNPLDGITEAREQRLPGTLSRLLSLYLENGVAQKDIIENSQKSAWAAFENEALPIRHALGEVAFALETIDKFGNGQQKQQFITQAKLRVPLRRWRTDELEPRLQAASFSREEASHVLYLFCQPTMLTLDEGELCSIATDSIAPKINRKAGVDESKRRMLLWLSEAAKNPDLEKIGDSSRLLEEIATGETFESDR